MILFNNKLFAQNGISLIGGIDYYQLANVGAQWNYSKRSSLELSVGSNFNVNKNTAWAYSLSFNQVFLKPNNWKVKPGYSIGSIFWTHNDDAYYFNNLSLPIMGLLSYPISSSLMIRIEGGIIFTKVLQSERKQNVIAGFPQRINENFGVKFIYKIKRNEK